MSVGARFLARDGFSAHGEVRLAGLRIEGDLHLRAAVLSNPSGDALLAYGIQTGGSVTLSEGFRAEGAVRLSRSRIGGGIFLDHACLENPAGDVIRCRNTQAQTLHLGPGLEASGIADFRNSQFAYCSPGSASTGLTFPGTGGRGRGCRRSRSGTGTGRSARPPGCWRSSPSAPWSSGCIIRRRWPQFRIPPSIRSSTRLT